MPLYIGDVSFIFTLVRSPIINAYGNTPPSEILTLSRSTPVPYKVSLVSRAIGKSSRMRVKPFRVSIVCYPVPSWPHTFCHTVCYSLVVSKSPPHRRCHLVCPSHSGGQLYAVSGRGSNCAALKGVVFTFAPAKARKIFPPQPRCVNCRRAAPSLLPRPPEQHKQPHRILAILRGRHCHHHVASAELRPLVVDRPYASDASRALCCR